MTSPSQNGARDPLRFIVLQPGARMHYAVPALLARAGMLERFYTDICADVGWLRHLGPLWPERMRPRPVARLLGRRLPREGPCPQGATGSPRVIGTHGAAPFPAPAALPQPLDRA